MNLTNFALIPSHGYGDGRPTRHAFSHRVRKGPVDIDGKATMYDALMFACLETGHVRQWGADYSVLQPSAPAAEVDDADHQDT